MSELDHEKKFRSDDPRVDQLVNELVSLAPVFNDANEDYIRGAVIITELEKMDLSASQTREVRDFLCFAWQAAATKATAARVFSKSPTDRSLSSQILGLYATHAGASLEVK